MKTTSKGKINKKDVSCVEELKLYLRQEAKSEKRLYHYTTYESLIEIIKNESFLLSRLDLLNDKAEKELGYHNDTFDNYIISFTKQKEYVSMWAMYGKPSGIKLRLDFDNRIFRKITPQIYIEKTKKMKFVETADLFGMDDPNFVITDVCYLDKHTNEVKHNTNSFNSLNNKIDLSLLTGIVKYDAWEFEKETRLKIRLTNSMIIEEYPEHIYYCISKDLIRSFHITFNPWMSENLKNEIKNSLNNLAGFELSFNDSDDDGEISEL